MIYFILCRVKLLEFTVEASNAEKKQLEQKFSVAKQESNLRVIEISRLNTLLDNAKAKVCSVFKMYYQVIGSWFL